MVHPKKENAMKKRFLLMAAVAMMVAFLVGRGTLLADEPAKESAAAKKIVVFDGDKIGDTAKGWTSTPQGKATVAAQDKEVRTTGKKAIEFHAEGKEYMGCGWNWYGWWPNDSGTDISSFKNLRFWAKLTGETKPTVLNATLVANDKDKKSGESCDLLQYCADLADGKWHEIVIPIKDLDAKNSLNRAKVWELMLGSWSQDEVKFSLFVDNIGFDGKGESSSQPASAAAPVSSGEPADSSDASPLPNAIDAKDPNIRYVGRWDMTNPAAPRASWTYSLVTAKFKGTAINARLKGGGYYQVAIDGQPTRVIAPKDGHEVYQLAKGLPAGEHVVEIVRRNEGAWIAPLTFLGFQLERDGQFLPLPPRSERRILIVGDSISCGYGNEATRDEHNPPDKEDGYMTYGAIAARKLSAEVQIIAWSGRKLYPNNTMVEVYDRTLANDPEPKADLKSWVPGVVLIDLGTNDFGNKNQQPDEKGWIAAYKSFIKTIRQTAPKAFIFVASGPMGTSANWDKWAKTVVADLNESGDKNVAYLPFATQDINGDGIGGDWHPNLKTHAKMADRLVQEIEKAVGWK